MALIIGWAVLNQLGVFEPAAGGEAADPDRIATDPYLGAEADSALVEIVEFSDFNCPSCATWHRAGILEQVFETYGEQTIRFVWRDFPVISAQSPKAAEAAQCAFDQDMFWEYHDYLFESASGYSVRNLKSYAEQLGLDTAEFNRCLDSGRHSETVDRDWSDALALRFRGTPSFVVNGQALVGPPSFQTLAQIIDDILAGS